MRPLGKAGEPLRVLSFSGGAYDTAMQMGVTHALLVSGLEPPHAVVGVSAGAINAVALAEILQAGDGTPKVSPAQVSKFRQILSTYVTVHREMATALLPDIYQVDAERPLRAAELPLQGDEEREHRNQAILAKAGLIDIANDLLGLRVSVRTLTLLLRTLLGLRAAATRGGLAGAGGIVTSFIRLWALFGANLFRLTPLMARLLAAIAQRVGRGVGIGIGGWTKQGLSAGDLIYPLWKLFRQVRRRLWVVFAGMVSGLVWLAFPAVLVVSWCCFRACFDMSRVGYLLGTGLWIWTWAKILVCNLLREIPPIVLACDLSALARLFSTSLVVATILFGCIFAFVVVAKGATSKGRDWLVHALFEHYDVADGLFDPHFLRSLFVRLFDPQYYATEELEDIVKRELRRESPSPNAAPQPRALSDYAEHVTRPIEVGVAAARVVDGVVEILRPDTPVVDALMTAVAIPPFFEPQGLPKKRPPETDSPEGKTWYIDGGLVSSEPISALIDRIKSQGQGHAPLAQGAKAVHIYSVSPLPLGKGLDGGDRSYDDLVDVALRSLQLEALRDQTLLRRMTHLYSSSLPGDDALQQIPPQTGKTFVKAWVIPIEPDQPIGLNRRLPLTTDDVDRRDLVLDAVADGCRAAIESMNKERLWRKGGESVSCGTFLRSLGGSEVPGSDPRVGPGLCEVCARCTLNRDEPDRKKRRSQRLRVPAKGQGVRDWPTANGPTPWSPSNERPKAAPLVPPSYEGPLAQDLDALDAWVREERKGASGKAGKNWPHERERRGRANQRPMVSLLFAGGVFRGVYLVGVLNALSELRVNPDIVAGSSIGTITAAMAATVLRGGALTSRRAEMKRLAGTFMTIDRLIMTDRFSNFVRGLTLRAAGTDFSMRELDHTFRTYDLGSRTGFGAEARRVLAGLERLFYFSPFDALELTREVRQNEPRKAITRLRTCAQDWLTRSEVGQQALGAEPLRALIDHHVVRKLNLGPSPPLSAFLEEGILFLATATNITKGSLEYLGLNPLNANPREATLAEALLASSAFPAVFRSRYSWEVMPRSISEDKYIDGGVMDNLPLDAVALVLNRLSEGNSPVIRRRPKTPHLMFTASLEAGRPSEPIQEVVSSWVKVWGRVAEMRYNAKLNSYAAMQDDLNQIYPWGKAAAAYSSVKIKVVSVIPAWLCSTFEFHPMLGFKPERQAASIAHGCASTLAAFSKLNSQWVADWGVDIGTALPGAFPPGESEPIVPRQPSGPRGCWFRAEKKCPFSQGVAKLVYEKCGEARTHRADGREI